MMRIIKTRSLAINIVVLICFSVGVCFASGEKLAVITLKNNGHLKGRIIKDYRDSVVLETGFGTVEVAKTDIKEIKYPSGDEQYIIEREYKGHQEAIQENIKNRELYKQKFDQRIKEKIRAIEESALRDIVIPFDNSSSIFVDVVMNENIKARLLLDTGATYVVISPDVADKLDLRPIKNAQSVKMTIADGSVLEGRPVILDSIRVEDVTVENVKAVIADSGESKGLLGMSFLRNFHVNIDPERKELTLREK